MASGLTLPILISLVSVFTSYNSTNNIKSFTNKSSLSEKSPLIIERADSAKLFKINRLNEDVLVLSGNAVLHYKDLSLKADRIVVNLNTRVAFGEGNVYLIDGSRRMGGDGFFYNISSNRGMVFQGVSAIDGILYKGKEIKTLDKDSYRITDGLFSSCALEFPHYLILAKKMWIYPDGSFFLLHLFYKTGNIPIFYLPFAFQTKKGTGIHTYVGYNSFKGYFIQNTWKRLLFKRVSTELRADAYQFGGFYTAAIVGHKHKIGETDISINLAKDRTILSNGMPAKSWKDFRFRYFYSIKEKLNIPSSSGQTRIEGYFFRASDYLFNSDYIANRRSVSGIMLPGMVQDLKALSIPLEQDRWYMNVFHSFYGFNISLIQRWNLYWNRQIDDFSIGTVNLPSFELSWNYKIKPIKISSNSSKPLLITGYFLNNYDLSISFGLDNTLFYDYITNVYRKTENIRSINLSLSRKFSFIKGLSYQPLFNFNDTLRTGKDLSTTEIENFKRLSYSSFGWSDKLSFAFHEFFSSPVKITLDLSRVFKKDLKESDSLYLLYNRVIKHEAQGTFSVSYPSLFSWNISSSVDLKNKKDQELNLLERDRFSELNSTASFSILKSLNFVNNYMYSIRLNKSVQNNMNLSLNLFRILNLNFNWFQNWLSFSSSFISAGYTLNFFLDRYTKIVFSVNSANNKLYLYSKEALKKMNLPESMYRNFFVDLLNSFNVINDKKKSLTDSEPFFSTKHLEDTAFKLQRISLFFERDLHCFTMRGGYSLRQAKTWISYIGSYPYWEHSIDFQIVMKRYESLRYRKESKTEPPKIKEQE